MAENSIVVSRKPYSKPLSDMVHQQADVIGAPLPFGGNISTFSTITTTGNVSCTTATTPRWYNSTLTNTASQRHFRQFHVSSGRFPASIFVDLALDGARYGTRWAFFDSISGYICHISHLVERSWARRYFELMERSCQLGRSCD